ncbi:hypothetical protein AOLI_G00059720 [Acnodon oligacanthus]
MCFCRCSYVLRSCFPGNPLDTCRAVRTAVGRASSIARKPRVIAAKALRVPCCSHLLNSKKQLTSQATPTRRSHWSGRSSRQGPRHRIGGELCS